MKKLLQIAVSLAVALPALATDIVEGKWNIGLDEATKRLSVSYDGRVLLADAYAEARLGDAPLQSFDATSVAMEQAPAADCFGTGTTYTLRYQLDGGAQLIQTFSFYDGLPYFVTRLSVTSPDGARSNYLVPLKSVTTNVFLPNDKQNRMLFVPWDNDGFIQYASNYLRRETNSYAVTAIYNIGTREGLVAGAVDHNLWKSAIHVVGSDYYKVDELALISGYTDEHSHDSIQSEGRMMPHGTVVADTVSSARFVFGKFDDWRTGLESFGEACAMVAPPRTWAGGAPYGWSSWGVMETKVSYQGVIDCADFIRDNLMPHGFHDQQGRVVMSLDAWWNDNLSTQQVKDFVAYCKANNMIPGLYYGSFCRFGDLQSNVPGTNGQYRFRDIALKVNGRYKVIDGAYCLDPTHPGTKLFMINDMNKFKSWGIEYLKCDFQSNGAIEADSWYNPDCHTGVQAYNEGMDYLMKRAGENIYLDLSISPLFPYQYTHGRRISCDAWGSIGHTKYVMNNTSYGWWLNKLYVANDPDHLVMKAHGGGGNESDGVNRARLTSGVVTGAYLSGDNFSDHVDRGYPEKSREAALKFLTNEDVNLIPRTCHSFRPVYGNADPNIAAESLMTYENEQYVYLAALSYQLMSTTYGTMTYADLGVDPANVAEIKELWTGEMVTPEADGFRYDCPGQDARIYRITKKTGTGIRDVPTAPRAASTAIYDLQGRHVTGSLRPGIYISNGKKYIAR